MYIPLIPQRREQPCSIWGPPGHGGPNGTTVRHHLDQPPAGTWPRRRSSPTMLAPEPHLYASPHFPSNENLPPQSDLRSHRKTLWLSPSSPDLQSSLSSHIAEDDYASSVSIPDARDCAPVTALEGTRRYNEGGYDTLLRTLNLTSPPPNYDLSLEESAVTSSSASSPVHSLPTPPDASPLHFSQEELSMNVKTSCSPNISKPTSPLGTPTKKSIEQCYGLPAVQSTAPGSQVDDIELSRNDMQTFFSNRFATRSGIGFDASRSMHDFNVPTNPFATSNLLAGQAFGVRSVSHNFDENESLINRSFHFENGGRRFVGFDRRPFVPDRNSAAGVPSASEWNTTAHFTSSEPTNFLHLLSPNSSPQYSLFVQRIIHQSDQQSSIFLQQKLKASSDFPQERMKIVDAICSNGFEMMCNRFGNWAVQRCLDSDLSREEKMKLVNCVIGRVVELATNCYGTHCLQKLLDSDEEIRLMIVSELLTSDPCSTLLNKHASHVWSKIMELPWSPPAPPIFDYIHQALAGKWLTLACHETGSLVVQHAFENLESTSKEGIVRELLRDEQAFREIVKNQWVLELGSAHHRHQVLELLLANILEYATHEHGIKSVLKAIRENDAEVRHRFIEVLCLPPRGGRRATVVDIALSAIGNQLLTSLLPNLSKEQRATLYDSIRPFIVTLRGSKTGSKAIWLFERMRSGN